MCLLACVMHMTRGAGPAIGGEQGGSNGGSFPVGSGLHNDKQLWAGILQTLRVKCQRLCGVGRVGRVGRGAVRCSHVLQVGAVGAGTGFTHCSASPPTPLAVLVF